MVHEPPRPATVNSFALPAVAWLLAVGIFVVDTFVVLPGAVAVLYVIVVLLVGQFPAVAWCVAGRAGMRGTHGPGLFAAAWSAYTGDHFVRLLVSLSAIGATDVSRLEKPIRLRNGSTGRRGYWTSRTTRSSCAT